MVSFFTQAPIAALEFSLHLVIPEQSMTCRGNKLNFGSSAFPGLNAQAAKQALRCESSKHHWTYSSTSAGNHDSVSAASRVACPASPHGSMASLGDAERFQFRAEKMAAHVTANH